MIDRYQGDPLITITPDGAEITVKGGQPVMDAGLSNVAILQLHTHEGWAGNYLLDSAQQIGSDFEKTARQANTLSKLALVEKSAVRALDVEAFGTVSAVATNPASQTTKVTITVQPPGKDKAVILATRNGQNWVNQASV